MDRMALNQLQKNVWTSWFGKVYTTYLWWFGGWFIPPTYGSNGSSGSQSVAEERLNKLIWGRFIPPIYGDLGDGLYHLPMVAMDRVALNQLQKNVWTSWFGEGLYHLSMVIWGRTSEQAGLGKVYSTYPWWFGDGFYHLSMVMWGWFLAPFHGDVGEGLQDLFMMIWGMVYSTYVWWCGEWFIGPIYDDLGDGW